MSNSKRRSTVHDFSSLRLHPDGTRVPLSQTAPKARHAKYTVQDHRGNWIAQDASGVDRVKTRRAAAKEQEEAREDEDGDVDESQVAGPSRTGEDKGKGRAVDDDEDVHELKDARAKRRKLFHEDVRLHGLGVRAAATLEEQPLPSGGSSPARVVQPAAFSQPNPSSVSTTLCLKAHTEPLMRLQDLLKCIHYFASTYYSEMGQLRDSSKEYRKEKKLRRLKRLQKQADRKAAAAQSDQKAGDGEDESSATSSSEEEETESEDESTTSKAPTSKKGSRNVRRAKALAGADMYKIFDGSALMAIGKELIYVEFMFAQMPSRNALTTPRR